MATPWAPTRGIYWGAPPRWWTAAGRMTTGSGVEAGPRGPTADISCREWTATGAPRATERTPRPAPTLQPARRPPLAQRPARAMPRSRNAPLAPLACEALPDVHFAGLWVGRLFIRWRLSGADSGTRTSNLSRLRRGSYLPSWSMQRSGWLLTVGSTWVGLLLLLAGSVLPFHPPRGGPMNDLWFRGLRPACDLVDSWYDMTT